MKNKSFISILIAIILGALIGSYTGTESNFFGITYYSVFTLIGTLFLNALMMVVVPLVMSSIISGIANVGKEKNFKSIGLKTFGMFLLTNFLAILVGFLLVNLLIDQFTDAAHAIAKIKNGGIPIENTGRTINGVGEVIQKIIPGNLFYALSNGQMLGIIFFSLIFGFSLTKIEGQPHETLKNFWNGLFQIFIKITMLIIKFLPLGVFVLVAKEFAETGLNTLKSLGFYLIICLVGLAIHFIIVLPLLLRFVGKVRPIAHIKAMTKALVTAFFTSSSSATIPVTLNCLTKNINVSTKISSLTIPLGSSINLSGTALFVVITSSFIALSYGIHLNFTAQLTIFLLTFLTTLGVASVPSGCLVTAMLVLKGLGVPAEGIGIVIAVDRVLDMFRTMTNVFSASSCTVIVAKLEGEKLLIDR